ncbi:Lar family restriction alleviation protein [Cloacibacillus porcorum]|uniref:Lar family restriction alleviation protein n=1 Tax=Cloacibacillus porcorum TaxID=1197717 RepID=UPI00346581BB
MPELKPCPFCGSKAKLYQAYDGSYCVQCTKCANRTLCRKTKETVIASWNRRANDGVSL